MEGLLDAVKWWRPHARTCCSSCVGLEGKFGQPERVPKLVLFQPGKEKKLNPSGLRAEAGGEQNYHVPSGAF